MLSHPAVLLKFAKAPCLNHHPWDVIEDSFMFKP